MVQTMTVERFGERLRRRVRDMARRIAAALLYFRVVRSPKGPGEPRVLTVTNDLGFYSSVLTATESCGWTTEWARSMKRAVEICRSQLVPIVIYDRNLPDVDWRRALDQLNGASCDVRILLAAPEVDEDLWLTVLHRRGYDVLSRSADPEQLQRELRFAWLSMEKSRLHGTAVLSRG